MLAIMLLAIIMAIVYGIVISTLQAQKEVEAIMESTEIGPSLLAQIREDLEGAFLPDAEGAYFMGYNRGGATGDRDRLDFVTSRVGYGKAELEEEASFHSVNEVGYQVQESRDPKNPLVGVLYRRQDYFIDKDPTAGGDLVELYDKVLHFSVEYFHEGRWNDSWDGEQLKGRLPEAVKIELRLKVGDNPQETDKGTYVTTITFPRLAPLPSNPSAPSPQRDTR